MNIKYQKTINFFLIPISVASGLLILELLIRLFYPQQLILIRPDVWCPDDHTGWKHCPDVSTTINSGEGTVRFTTDSNGFRIDPDHVRQSSRTRILAIGDSFLEAIQVNDNETVTERVKTKLFKQHGVDVSVINAGVGGWDPNQYFIQTKILLAKSRFDLGIVFIYIGNDIVTEKILDYPPRTNSMVHHLRIPGSLSLQEIKDSFLYPVNDYLEQYSHLFVLFKNRFAQILMRIGLTGYSIKPIFYKSEVESARWKTTAEICLAISEVFDTHDTPVFFVFLPTDYQIDQKRFKWHIEGLGIPEDRIDLDQPNKLLMIEMKRYGLNVIDILSPMRSSLYKSDTPLFGKVDNHLNAAGHDFVADIIIPKIIHILHLGDSIE